MWNKTILQNHLPPIKINTGTEWDNISTIFSINTSLIYLTSDRVFTEKRSLTHLEMNEPCCYPTQTTHFLSGDWETCTPCHQCSQLHSCVLPPDRGLVWERTTTWIIPWGLERVGRTNQGIKNQCFCEFYRTSADCTQPPLPVSLPGNQWLHYNTVDLHTHILSIITLPACSQAKVLANFLYKIYYT